MLIAVNKTFSMKKVQQDINNRRKRLSQNFAKIKSKINFFRSKNGPNYEIIEDRSYV